MNCKTLLELPIDILVNILKLLDIRDVLNLMRTCKTLMNFIINDNTIWRKKGQRELIVQNPINSDPDSWSWYNRCKISHNWRKGIYINKVILHHDTLYMPWLQFHKSEILLLSLGSDLFCFPTNQRGLPNCRNTLWALDVPTVRRYDVRTNDISRFVVRDNIILCGNRDGCVAVFLFENPRSKPILLCHIDNCHQDGGVEVTAVEGIKTPSSLCVVSGSLKSSQLSIWTWRFTDNEYEYLFEEMQNMNCRRNMKILPRDVGVRCLATNYSKDKFAIGLTGNSKPLVLDANTCEFVMSLDMTRRGKFAIRDIQWLDKNTLAFVTHSGVLQLLDIRSNRIVYNTMDPFQSSLYCLKTDNNNSIVVGTSEYSRCVLFDKRHQGRHVQMYYTQKKSSPIYSLAFSSSKLIAAADRSIAFVDFDVNPSSIRSRDYSHMFEFLKR